MDRERQIVLLHLLVKERAVNTQGLRRSRLVIIDGLKRVKDGLSLRPGLYPSQGSIVGETRSPVCPMQIGGKIAGVDRISFQVGDDTLENIGDLTHVSGPVIARENFLRFWTNGNFLKS